MFFINVFLLLFIRQNLANANLLLEAILIEWDHGNTTNNLEQTNPIDRKIDEESVDEKIKLVDANVLPIPDCIAREIFRQYEPFCYKRTYGRGAGHPLNACPADAPDQSGLLCYPRCQDGYDGLGPVCWHNCGDMKPVGCLCVDSHGHIFIRKSYGQGVGKAMICSSEYEQSGALCYNYCDKRYQGVGPVCWQKCPALQPVDSVVGCSITSAVCAKFIIESVAEIVGMIFNRVLLDVMKRMTAIVIDSATRNNWIPVAGNISILADKFADTVLPDISKKCGGGSSNLLSPAMKNVSFELTVAAFSNTEVLKSFLRLFDISNIITIFNHGLCNLPDDFYNILN